MITARYYDAVLFDLLTALLDSWTLWNEIAGSEERGHRWRAEYLRRTYETGEYMPYEALVAESAVAVAMPRSYAAALDARFAQLRPWPDVQQTLTALKAAGVTIGVVTNCSERLGRIAAGCVGVELDVLVTAESAGFYKPHPRTYGLALEELGVDMDRCLFVAGSAYDLFGTAKVGLSTYWHDRLGMTPPVGMPEPIARERTLGPLLPLVLR